MQGVGMAAENQPSSLLAHSSASGSQIITPKRLGYGVAGGFVLVGAAVILHGTATSQSAIQPIGASHSSTRASTATTRTDKNSTSTNTDSTAPSVNTTTSFSSTGAGSAVHTQLNVNGQDIPVPTNGSAAQTVTNSNGSQTTVHVSGSSTEGAAVNNSHSSVTINVHSSSSSKEGNAQP